MQKFIITTLLWIAAFTLCSCQEDFVDPDAPTPTNQMVQVEIPITTSSMEVLTRTDENVIKDVNVYFFHTTITAFFRHTYGSATTVATDLTPGTYKVLVITNMHRDLGNKSYLDLSQIELSAQDTYNDLVMTYTGEITINSSASQITLPPLTVKRNVARINYRVGVTSQAADITIKSLQVENVPLRMAAFSDTAFAAASNYSSANFINNTPTEEMLQGTFYMLPNKQGVVSSITSQSQKNKANAPANATYLLIHALRGNKVLVYRIYLGANNTSDFNVQSNTAHTMVVNITGDKTTDTRVYSYTVSVKDNIETLYSSPYCTWSNKYNQLSITMEGENLDAPLSAQIQVVGGDKSNFHFNNKIGHTSYKLQLAPGTTNYKLGYYTDAPTKPMFTTANKDLVYQVVVSDAYGFSQTYSVTHNYANKIGAIYKDGTGSVTADKALYTCAIPGGIIHGTPYLSPGIAVFYDETGYTIRATPKAGYIFTEWRDNSTHDIISTSTPYTYRASTPSPDLRTDFIVPLSLACSENNKNSTFKINRNQITLTDNNNMTSADVRITCNSADGFFIRNAERNPATEVYEGATVTSYTERVNFSGGQARPAEVSFFPIREGSYSYKIEIMNSSTGAVITTKLVTQEIVKSSIFIDVSIRHPLADMIARSTPSLEPPYLPIISETWYNPCRLEVYALLEKGTALDYIPAGLTVGYDAKIQYCTSANVDQCISRDGLSITTVTRYGNVPVRRKSADEAIIFPLAHIYPENEYLSCTTPKSLKIGGWAWSSSLMMNIQGTLSNLRCNHPQLTTTTLVQLEVFWMR